MRSSWQTKRPQSGLALSPADTAAALLTILAAQLLRGAQMRDYFAGTAPRWIIIPSRSPNDLALHDLLVCDAEVVDEEQVESFTRRGYRTVLPMCNPPASSGPTFWFESVEQASVVRLAK